MWGDLVQSIFDSDKVWKFERRNIGTSFWKGSSSYTYKIPSGYIFNIAMENPPMLLRTLNHLCINGPFFFHGYVSHNQRVSYRSYIWPIWPIWLIMFIPPVKRENARSLPRPKNVPILSKKRPPVYNS